MCVKKGGRVTRQEFGTQFTHRTISNLAQIVIKEGDDQYDAMRFYFVESGECKAISKNDGKDVVIGTMGVGDFFGEKALIEKKPRACDVVSSGKTVLAALDVAGFERIMGPCKAEMTEKIQRCELFRRQNRVCAGGELTIGYPPNHQRI